MMLLIASSASRSKIPPSNSAGAYSDSTTNYSSCSALPFKISSSESEFKPLAILCQGCIPPFVWFRTVTLYLLGPWRYYFLLGSTAIPFILAIGLAVVIFMSKDSLWFAESFPSVLSLNSVSLFNSISLFLTIVNVDSCFPLITYGLLLSSVSCELPKLPTLRRELSYGSWWCSS